MKYQNLNREKKKDTIVNNRNSFIIKCNIIFPIFIREGIIIENRVVERELYPGFILLYPLRIRIIIARRYNNMSSCNIN